MRKSDFVLMVICAASAVPLAAATRPRPHAATHHVAYAATSRHAAHGRTLRGSSRRSTATHSVERGQPAVIAPERATQIQEALIHNGYMTGEPTGQWDSASVDAMRRVQSDNGWQTKVVPDSRALIKLGLGPQTVAAGVPE